MKNQEDMNKYNTSMFNAPTRRVEGELSQTAGATAKSICLMILKAIKSALFILIFAGILVFISVFSYILTFKDLTPPDISMNKLNYTSHIYVKNSSTGEMEKYDEMYLPSENRIWVEFKDIPQAMKDAIVSTEDKRFYSHHGVDWITTAKSVLKLFSSSSKSGGGSTITQQLIKNITEENQVSILRKIKEIFMALNLDSNYNKDEILEAYLNVVNFGGSTSGVQAAANLYFGKDIADCDIAECASIAGITQYPVKYNPLNNPDENRERQKTVLFNMHDQGKITDSEYAEALEKANNGMVFVGKRSSDDDNDNKTTSVWNWYQETLFYDLIEDLMELYNCSRDYAINLLNTAGFEIYCAMDVNLQESVEALFLDESNQPKDPNLLYGIYAMDYDGRVITVVGSRQQKTGNRWSNYATQVTKQTGSTMKPLSVYAPALENGLISYGSVLLDEPLPNYGGKGKSGPKNVTNRYEGYMNVDRAIEVSQNAPAVQIVNELTPEVSYDFLVDRLHFTLDPRDAGLSIALGGLTYGVTVEEMTAAYQIFGNGGVYNKPYTYYWVKDYEGNIILDNTNKTGEQAISEENATIMNKLLHLPIYGSSGSGRSAQIDGVDIFGKTGTTNDGYDIWFVGGTPFCVSGVWLGYKTNNVVSETKAARALWKTLIEYLNDNYDYSDASFTLSDNVSKHYFCRNSGKLAGKNCYNSVAGWYNDNTISEVGVCNGGSDHVYGSSNNETSESSSSQSENSSEPSASESSQSSLPDNPGESSASSNPDTPTPSESSSQPSPESPSTPSQAQPEEPSQNQPETPEGGNADEPVG